MGRFGMQIILAKPRGFCAGVDRAILVVERALEIYGSPVYVLHEIVHNKHVVAELGQKGAKFVDSLEAIPTGSVVIFSAHGIAPTVRTQAHELGLSAIDATCPLVAKVHMEVIRANRNGTEVIMIGHRGHAEVIGTMGHYQNPTGGIYLVEKLTDIAELTVKDSANLCFVTQTTLSVDESAEIIDALRKRFPKISAPPRGDICYATTNRQAAVRRLALQVELVLVVGSKNSSNSNRLLEVAQCSGKPAYLIDGAGDIQRSWLTKVERVGITAGASAPESLIKEVVSYLSSITDCSVTEDLGDAENISFALPKILRQDRVVAI